MFVPVPRTHRPYCLTTSLPTIRLLHPHDDLPPLPASRKLQLRKYNPFSIRTHRADGSSITRAAILVRRALLKVWISQNPRPPVVFDIVSVSHRFQCVRLRSVFVPHQKYTIYELTFEHHVLVRLKMLIMYVGIAVRTAFISTSLPA